MNVKASDADKLLCDNNTVETHHVNQSDFLKKTWLSRHVIMSVDQIILRKLGFLDKIFSKNQFFLFPTKFIRISRRIKQGEHRQ